MYTYLEELHSDNKKYLEQIASAAFVLCIDDTKPAPANSEQVSKIIKYGIEVSYCPNTTPRNSSSVLYWLRMFPRMNIQIFSL